MGELGWRPGEISQLCPKVWDVGIGGLCGGDGGEKKCTKPTWSDAVSTWMSVLVLREGGRWKVEGGKLVLMSRLRLGIGKREVL